MGKALAHALKIERRDMVILAVAAVLIAGAFLADGEAREPLSSAETRFVETSPGGLQIVPASCPSSPHKAGACSGDTTARRVGECLVWASNYSINPGEGTTLSWFADDAFGGGDSSGFGMTATYTYVSGSITNIGSVARSGSTAASPAQTTTYVFTANYVADAPSIIFPPISVTCDATITVAGSPQPPPQCPPNWVSANGQCQPPQQQPQCTAQYFCSGNDQYFRNAQCGESLIQACAWGCSGGGCLPPPPPQGNITASPSVVRSGNASTISWTTQNAESCTVTEDNPDISDAWGGPNGSQASSGLAQQTVYTLTCIGLDGSTFTDTAKVNIIPVWEEL